MKTFKSRAVNSVKWTSYKTFINAGISLLTQFILAKFIAPKEFANLSAIMIVMGFAKIIQNLGITQSVIQKEKVVKEEISSLFFLSTVLSLIIGSGIFMLSGPIAHFYSLANLQYYIKLISISICLSGPTAIFRSMLEKKMIFKEMAIIEILSFVITFLFTLILLFYKFGVLAVVLANIISAIFGYIALAILFHKKVGVGIKFYYKGSLIKPFLKFGILVSSKDIMTYLAHRMDELIIGHFLKPEILGIYYFGKKLLETLRALMTKSFSKVLYPLFSNLNSKGEILVNVYKKVTSYIAIIAFPIFLGVAVTAHLFVPIVFGMQWIESIKVFQVFSVLMVFMILTANISTSLLYSLNKPGIVLCVDLIANIIYFSLLLIFSKNGMIYILIIYSLYIISKTIALQFVSNYYINNTFKDYLKILKPSFVTTLVMVLMVLLFQYLAEENFSRLFVLIGSIIIGIGTFLTILLRFYKEIVNNILNTFKTDRVK